MSKYRCVISVFVFALGMGVTASENYVDPANITATAFSEYSASYPLSRSSDGSGLDSAVAYHSAVGTDMWRSGLWSGVTVPSPIGTTDRAWVKYQFDKAYPLGQMWIWNYNLSGQLTRGMKKVEIYYTSNGINWTKLRDCELPQATGTSSYACNFIVDFNGVQASAVAIIAYTHSSGGNYGAVYYGLSEVRFYLYKPALTINNPSFESPIVADGGTNTTITDWKTYIWSGWQGPVTRNPASSEALPAAAGGSNYAYVDAGSIFQYFDVPIEPETTYILSLDLVNTPTAGGWYDLRLRCDERNADLATASNAAIPFPAVNQWITAWCRWDSGNSVHVGRKMQVWCKGGYIGLDNFKLTVMRTNPALAYLPSPAYDSFNASYNPTLTWKSGDYAAVTSGHDVYFGTDFNSVCDANITSPEYRGRQDANSFNPGQLDEQYKIYYWRIDEVNGSSVWKGNVWKFATPEPVIRNIQSSTWPATDSLGRKMPMYRECGPQRADRFVGLFYYNAGGGGLDQNHDGIMEFGPNNSTQTIAAHIANPSDPNGNFGWVNFHWAEPEMGYYVYWDEYVIRKHAQMFADAGVDVLFIPGNTLITPTSRVYGTLFAETICRVFSKIRAEGGTTPQIAFLIMNDDGGAPIADLVYNEFYAENRYPGLWFYWLGKPLMLSQPDPTTLSTTVKNFFTLRECWAWTSDSITNKWAWLDDYPQDYAVQSGLKESIAVSAASHPTRNIGRSYSGGSQPAYDAYHLTPYSGEGRFFTEQWGRALSVDPQLVFVTEWNGWISGCYQGNGTQQFLGHITYPDDPIWYYFFVDAYNQEYSRDIEPMKGGHTDNYYYQLVNYVRKYKGAQPPSTTSRAKTISIDGNFSDWADVRPEFGDNRFDTFHRNETGWSNNFAYSNVTGRNDFVTLKVARDDNYVYFYAETDADITPYTDPNWMLLFIDADKNGNTGWNGYDYVVNYGGVTSATTTLRGTMSGWNWFTVNSNIAYAVSGNKLELKIPRADIGQGGATVAMDFHWADNIQKFDDIIEFAVSGDSAPNRRFNYRYDTSVADKACEQLQGGSQDKAMDLDNDCDIDIDDLHLFAQAWLDPYKFTEFAEMTKDWLLDYMPDSYTGSELLQDDFETGDFGKYYYVHSGNAPWTITSVLPYQGSYCAKSGVITHNQQSSLEITIYNTATSVSFYRKVSSESNYDYLRFYIDGVVKGSWSGTQSWALQIYPISPGRHTFKWVYSKDGSQSSGSDCAWIDLVQQ